MSLENPNNFHLIHGFKMDTGIFDRSVPEPVEEPEVEEENEIIDLDSRRYRKYLREFNSLSSVVEADVMWRHLEGQSLSDMAWETEIAYEEVERIRGDALAELGKMRAKKK